MMSVLQAGVLTGGGSTVPVFAALAADPPVKATANEAAVTPEKAAAPRRNPTTIPLAHRNLIGFSFRRPGLVHQLGINR